jgi:FlaA1/EpsC-like NDP-sugar epimerase
MQTLSSTAHGNARRLLIKHRRLPIVGLHLALIALSNYFAFWLRFDGTIPAGELARCQAMLPWLVAIRGLLFIPFQLYEGLWRYTSIFELRNVLAACGLSTVVFYLFVHGYLQVEYYPRSIYIIDTLVLIFLIGGVRLSHRLNGVVRHIRSEKKVLIYGAGDAGEMIVRDMISNRALYRYEPVGFIDDNPQKLRQHIHGVPVLGTRQSIPKVLKTHQPDVILLAVPSAAPALMRELLAMLAHYKVPIKTLPSQDKLQDGKVGVNQMQNLSVEDLLERLPVGMDLERVRSLISGKRVLVTGAGGSIGSELCRQVAQYDPEKLILLDKSESALYDIDMELQRSYPELKRVAALADITNSVRLKQVFSRHLPQIIFHAAAYKHVPMMEHHPGEAVYNNVVGTHRLVQVALRRKVERFVLISTDKAVNPTNVMGATKRAGEMYIQALARQQKPGATVFSAVRFGNVLGSNGSVVPLFLKQIKEGGPVTITHPEVKRYFMTIPEAVLLVLLSATLARGGEIFVLEMGEQIKLLDMAHHLIRLAGLIPGEDIAIRVIGLRPGEKLREELVGSDEALVPSEIDKIHRVESGSVAKADYLFQKIAQLERLVVNGHSRLALELLYQMVPTFRPLDLDTARQIGSRRMKKDPLPTLSVANESA